MTSTPVFLRRSGIAVLFSLLSASIIPAQELKSPHDQDRLAPAVESPYDLRGLTIEPGLNEPRHVLDTNLPFPLISPSRANPVEPRMIAEWEPVQAALIAYPLGIAVNAVKTIASEIKTYVLCSSYDQSAATTSFKNAGVNMANIEFVTATTDTYWTRDYGPWWITNSENGKRVVRLVDLVYRKDSEPRPNDDRIPSVLASYLKLGTYFSTTFVCQGGNVMTDSLHVGASTDRVKDDNPDLSLTEIKQIGQTYFGFNPYYVMTDPAYPADYIKHIDCWAKFISPTKVLVKRVPSSWPDYSKFENAARVWASTNSASGQPYTVIRIDGEGDSPYTNHVILNDRVLVPIMTSETDSTDKTALDQIKAAYGPSYRVIGVKAAPGLDWLGTDSIHCRVNSIPVFTGLFDQDTALAFTNQPASQAVAAGASVTFTVEVTGGTKPYSYLWHKNDVAVGSATTSANYTFTAQADDDGAKFHVVVTDSSSPAITATSNKATLTITAQHLSIIQQPVSQTVNVGQTAKFTVTATGAAPLSYQWKKNDTAISGASLASYTTPLTTMADNGAKFTVTVSNVGGSVTSSVATLTVSPKSLDLNADAVVDVLDILEMTMRIGSTNSADLLKADLDSDGDIDDQDLTQLQNLKAKSIHWIN